MKITKVFIGSSSEGLPLAESVQSVLSHNANLLVNCWSQGVFRVGNYPMEDLMEELHQTDFAVFVLSPDDYTVSRNTEYYTARDNILFELGLFMGFLGRERTFFIMPDGGDLPYKIPSDLFGLNSAKYRISSVKKGIDAALGPACTQIKSKINQQMIKPDLRLRIKQFGLFPEFDSHYKRLFTESQKVTTYFIHSRRWRENNLENISQFFQRDGVYWTVFLPDVRNEQLIDHLEMHFLDGSTLRQKIQDAYLFFLQYMEMYPDKLSVYMYSLYPTYTAYLFDDSLIVSMYPLTNDRRATPAFMLDNSSPDAEFFIKDLEDISTTSMQLEIQDIKDIFGLY